MADNILDKMTLYVNHKNDQNPNNKDLVNMIRNNLVKRRQFNAKIYAHNMAVRARNNKLKTIEHDIQPETIEHDIQPETIEHDIQPETIEPLQKQHSTTGRRKLRVIMDKSVITNNIIF
jgi:hypothetical protein